MTAAVDPRVFSVEAGVLCACVAGDAIVLGHAGVLRVYAAPCDDDDSTTAALRPRCVVHCANSAIPSALCWLPSVQGLAVIQLSRDPHPGPEIPHQRPASSRRESKRTSFSCRSEALVYPQCLLPASEPRDGNSLAVALGTWCAACVMDMCIRQLRVALWCSAGMIHHLYICISAHAHAHVRCTRHVHAHPHVHGISTRCTCTCTWYVHTLTLHAHVCASSLRAQGERRAVGHGSGQLHRRVREAGGRWRGRLGGLCHHSGTARHRRRDAIGVVIAARSAVLVAERFEIPAEIPAEIHLEIHLEIPAEIHLEIHVEIHGTPDQSAAALLCSD